MMERSELVVMFDGHLEVKMIHLEGITLNQ